MGYWGWRPLVFGLFISTWVVGCNIVTDNNVAQRRTERLPASHPDRRAITHRTGFCRANARGSDHAS